MDWKIYKCFVELLNICKVFSFFFIKQWRALDFYHFKANSSNLRLADFKRLINWVTYPQFWPNLISAGLVFAMCMDLMRITPRQILYSLKNNQRKSRSGIQQITSEKVALELSTEYVQHKVQMWNLKQGSRCSPIIFANQYWLFWGWFC